MFLNFSMISISVLIRYFTFSSSEAPPPPLEKLGKIADQELGTYTCYINIPHTPFIKKKPLNCRMAEHG